MSTDLIQEMRGPVLWLTINREEKRNALTMATMAEIREALAAAQNNKAVHAVVITGAGTRAFCAGADLGTGASFAFDYSVPHMEFANLFRQVRQLTVPLIARVNGACMAGGMGLMSMCDMVVASDKAIFGLPEVKIGLFPAQVLTVLRESIPQRVLNEMCITGEPLNAAQALQYNLVNYVDADLDGKLDWLLQRLLDKSPSAIRRGLYTLKTTVSMPFEETMAFTESQIALFALTEDAKEGQLAFREKRKPVWTGK